MIWSCSPPVTGIGHTRRDSPVGVKLQLNLDSRPSRITSEPYPQARRTEARRLKMRIVLQIDTRLSATEGAFLKKMGWCRTVGLWLDDADGRVTEICSIGTLLSDVFAM